MENAKKEKEEEKYQEGYSECILVFLDKFFKCYLDGKYLANIDILGPISYSLLKKRYNNYACLEDFAKILREKNLLID